MNPCQKSVVGQNIGVIQVIDIRGGSKDPRSARLSNFTNRPFIFDGIQCAGVEGILQALKETHIETQVEICGLPGRLAKKAGLERGAWKQNQILWWRGVTYPRNSREYQALITRIYDAVYEQDPTFKTDLLALGTEDICHTIANPDQRETVLTEVEMIHQLNRLRIRAQRDLCL